MTARRMRSLNCPTMLAVRRTAKTKTRVVFICLLWFFLPHLAAGNMIPMATTSHRRFPNE
ncbi:hypothetical protein BS47DRAFT_1345416 [Hydnum rufescens UP504]|uniref:Uncharacterized protein n=1 Tax=Hydnum rufescens UP504 TaxID=1448309 RepID=A0A9P6DW84_9AGAM|nr:hypothetical protein BS47DRAFT_1345416 [Hydnum rufescens UP504]